MGFDLSSRDQLYREVRPSDFDSSAILESDSLSRVFLRVLILFYSPRVQSLYVSKFQESEACPRVLFALFTLKVQDLEQQSSLF